MKNPDKTYLEFAKRNLEGFKETLRTAVAFNCACCEQQKMKGEAAGAHLYKPENVALWKAMQTVKGPRVGVYALCLECVDKYSEEVINQKVTAYLGKQGLFDHPKKVQDRNEQKGGLTS